MSLPISFVVESFDKIWKAQVSEGRQKDFARFLLLKLKDANPELPLEFEVVEKDGSIVQLPLLPTKPEPIELPLTPQQEIEKLKKENQLLQQRRDWKMGNKEAVLAANPEGLTVQEIADLYGLNPQTVRVAAEHLEDLGVRWGSGVGKPPTVYSRASVEKLAAEREWEKRPEGAGDTVLVEKLNTQG